MPVANKTDGELLAVLGELRERLDAILKEECAHGETRSETIGAVCDARSKLLTLVPAVREAFARARR